MKKLLDVPYFSQHAEATEDFWKNKSCGVASVKMVLDFLEKDTVSIDDLIDEGQAIGGYTKDGWVHDSMVHLLHNHGVPAYREEFRSITVDAVKKEFAVNPYQKDLINYGITKIGVFVDEDKPVLVSVDPKFDENKDSHIIVITGYETDGDAIAGFYYNDPDNRSGEEKKDRYVELDTFMNYWRKFAIFVA